MWTIWSSQTRGVYLKMHANRSFIFKQVENETVEKKPNEFIDVANVFNKHTTKD